MRSSFDKREIELGEHGALAIAGADLLHRDDRRAELARDFRPLERQHAVVDHHRDRRHFGEHFYARLRLARLGRAGAETVDEGLQVLALLLLLLHRLAGERLLLRALALEAGIAAAPQRQLALVEMQDVIDDVVEQVAVVADDEDRRG